MRNISQHCSSYRVGGPQGLLSGLWVLLFAWIALPAAAAENALQDIEISSLPNRGIELVLTASGPLERPSSFHTKNPARIALDFWGMANQTGNRDWNVGMGMLRDVALTEGGDRLRVVVNLVESVPYTMDVAGNQLTLILAPAVARSPAKPPLEAALAREGSAQPATSVAAGSGVGETPFAGPLPPPIPGGGARPMHAAGSPASMEMPSAALDAPLMDRDAPLAAPTPPGPGTTSAETPMPDLTAAAWGQGLEDVDFRRGAEAEARVVFSLSNPNTVVDVQEEAGRVVMDFLNAQAPERLLRRFDVSDFATPVKHFEVTNQNGNVHVEIIPLQEFQYLAYQTDDSFTVELQPLTKEEKDELKKQQVGYTGERLSLNFQDIEVRSVLQLLGDFTGLNMVVSDTVKGNITLRLQNVPWDQALDIILKTKGLAKRQVDNVVMVAPAQELAASEKQELESKQQIEELAPVRAEYFQINYAEAAAIAGLLKSQENQLLTPGRGNVTFDKRTNMLLVRDTTASLENIQRLINRLDVPVRQVMIESRVVVASNDFARDLGVRLGFSRSNQWNNTEIFIGGSQTGGIEGTEEVDMGSMFGGFNSTIDAEGAQGLMVNLPASGAGVLNMVIGKLGSYLLQLELSAMEREGKGEIISSPRVVTSDKNAASIQQGVQIPYQSVDEGGNPTTAMVDAVLSLQVTPSITPDDRVIMDLTVTKDAPNFANAVDGQPAIDTRSVQTKVLVDNGETVVLGGVFEQSTSESVDKVPLFGDIPVLGRLFKHTTRSVSNNELLIFVTPKILKEALGMR